MSQSCSVSTDWTLPTALASPSHRAVECLPAEPLFEHHLASLFVSEAVVEVWLPLCRRRMTTENSRSERPIRDVWIEFADRLHAVRYEQPGGQCPLAWYRGLRPIETDTKVSDDLLAQYTRLSERPVASV